MLVLTRKEGQSIEIGPSIRITVARLCGDKVRIGIECPRDIGVHRSEVAERIAAGVERAARQEVADGAEA